MSIRRWLLLLLPSAPIFFAGPIAAAWSWAHDVRGEATIGPILGSLLITFGIAVVPSAVLGAQMEKWKRGAVESIPRIIVYTLNILFTACFVGWGGFALVYAFVRKFSAP